MEPGPAEDPPWDLVEQILDQILDESAGLDSGEPLSVSRERLDELCGENTSLRQEVELLLAESGRREDVFGRGLAVSLPDLLGSLDEPSLRDELGPSAGAGSGTEIEARTIDRYRLLEVLGRGGMGVVYLAERADTQFDKRVALKVIPRGLESPERERRFRTERQILARLEHEGIARLLDGGVTDDGYPYLAMELVEGEKIDTYCERHLLSQRQRLELFLQVCAAVQYAHENLILHRDLKPGNIFVTADGVVKLLDFGVGKILDESDVEQGTRFQPMTPEYASPEQRENRPVSTATDVFSLGLVLRQLITGVMPSDTEASTIASVPGDLRIIVEKALRHSPERRFRSVSEMTADIERYLSGRPISARPATLPYRLGKFLARNRLATAGSMLAALLAVLSVGAIVQQGRVARQERDRARIEAQKAKTVAELLGSLFAAADPNSPSAGQVNARELLQRGEVRAEQELADQPGVRGELLSIIGAARASLGDTAQGIALVEEAIRIHRTQQPVDALSLSEALRTLASLHRNQGELDQATSELEEAMTLLREARALDSVDAALLLRDLGRVETIANRDDQAEAHFRAALKLLESHGRDVDAALTKTDIATILDRTNRLEEAARFNDEALATFLASRGEDHPMVSDTRNNIAIARQRLGHYDQAERLFRDLVAAEERVYGVEHPALSVGLSNLGKVLMDQGDFEEAAPIVRRATELRRAGSPPDSFNRIAVEMNLAGLEVALGELEEAISIYRNGLERFERLTGAKSGPSVRVSGLLGIALHRAGDRDAAEALLGGALSATGVGAPPLHRAELLVGLGAVLADGGRGSEAEPLLREALAIWLDTVPPDHWRVAEARTELAGALLRKELSTAQDRADAEQLLAATAGLDLDRVGFSWARSRAMAMRELSLRESEH